MLEEKVGANTAARYVWSPVYVDALVLRDRDTDGNGTLDERLWVQQDANWNVTALVNGSGVVVERYAYDPFGARTVYDASYTVRSGGSSYDFRHGFQGMAFDAVAGLSPQRFRWYSPVIGRWTSADPIRFEAGDVNLYGFVGCNPININDPSGLAGNVVLKEGELATIKGNAGEWKIGYTAGKNDFGVFKPDVVIGYIKNIKGPVACGDIYLIQVASVGAWMEHKVTGKKKHISLLPKDYRGDRATGDWFLDQSKDHTNPFYAIG